MWRKIWSVVKEGLSIFLPAAGLVLFVILMVAVAVDWYNNEVILRPIEIPKSLVDLGYTPDVVSQRLIAEYNNIERQAYSVKKGQQIDKPGAQPDIQLPGLGLSVYSLELMLRRLVGDEPRVIEGEIAEVDGQLNLRLWLNADLIAEAELPTSNDPPVDNLIRSGAEGIVRTIDPYSLASYYYDRDKKKATEIIQYCLSQNKKAEMPWAYNLWGLIYLSEKKYLLAERKFEAAIAHDPNFSIAYENLASTYSNWAGRPDAPRDAVSLSAKNFEQAWDLTIERRVRIGMHQVASQEIRDPHDEVRIGYMYFYGYHVGQDAHQAAQWFQMAAEDGDATGEYDYALSVSEGDMDPEKNDPQTMEEAAIWYRAAAEKGNSEAQNALGDLYRDGEGVDADETAAVGWYTKAAEQNNATAQDSLGDLYRNSSSKLQNDGVAAMWFCLAARQDNSAAQVSLAEMYEHGQGVPRDPAAAFHWYALALEVGTDNDALIFQNMKRLTMWPRQEKLALTTSWVPDCSSLESAANEPREMGKIKIFDASAPPKNASTQHSLFNH